MSDISQIHIPPLPLQSGLSSAPQELVRATENPVSRPFPKWHLSAFPHLGCPLPSCPYLHHRPIHLPDGASASVPGGTRTTNALPSLRYVGATSPPTTPWLSTSSDDQQPAGHHQRMEDGMHLQNRAGDGATHTALFPARASLAQALLYMYVLFTLLVPFSLFVTSLSQQDSKGGMQSTFMVCSALNFDS
jgi:hypothetical protein